MRAPHVASYYKSRRGFCLSQIQRDALEKGRYLVRTHADLQFGVLNDADLVLPELAVAAEDWLRE